MSITERVERTRRTGGAARPLWLGPAFMAALVAAAVLFELTAPAERAYGSYLGDLARGYLAGGSLPDLFRGGAVVAWWVLVILLAKPLAITGMFFTLEVWICGRERLRRKYALAWAIQAFYLAFMTPLAMLLDKLFPLAAIGPLVQLSQNETLPIPLWLQATGLMVLSVFIADIAHYWQHRAMHTFPWLWKIHAVHHSNEDLDVVHSFDHPLDSVVKRVFFVLPASLLFGFEYNEILVLLAFLSIHNRLLHSPLPVNFGPFVNILADNRFHFLHHSRLPKDYDRNFAAVFPVIDWMFGTYNRPDRHLLAETGLDSHHPPRTFWQYLFARLEKRQCAPEADLKP